MARTSRNVLVHTSIAIQNSGDALTLLLPYGLRFRQLRACTLDHRNCCQDWRRPTAVQVNSEVTVHPGPEMKKQYTKNRAFRHGLGTATMMSDIRRHKVITSVNEYDTAGIEINALENKIESKTYLDINAQNSMIQRNYCHEALFDGSIPLNMQQVGEETRSWLRPISKYLQGPVVELNVVMASANIRAVL